MRRRIRSTALRILHVITVQPVMRWLLVVVSTPPKLCPPSTPKGIERKKC